eukprot:COSAG02_NODE_52546_length_307_cov_0.740385_1_plen_83_part_10
MVARALQGAGGGRLPLDNLLPADRRYLSRRRAWARLSKTRYRLHVLERSDAAGRFNVSSQPKQHESLGDQRDNSLSRFSKAGR